MKHFLLGTSGHVDHGKTSLIKALTGVDTDRLPQEKKRGLSIELGFAPLELWSPDRDESISVSVIDVPGHQRYLRSAISGVGGFDAALLVIDSSAGVKPQTKEHLKILELLGVERGLIVLTKADRSDAETRQLVRWEISELASGTFLEAAEIAEVSIFDNDSILELKAKLFNMLSGLEPRSPRGFGRLPIDRVFLKPGFGPVVTGSLWSGSLGSGDEVELKPLGQRIRVRGVQVHGQPVDRAVAGQRVAVSLTGVELEALKRGQTLGCPPFSLANAELFAVSVRLSEDLLDRALARLAVTFYQATWHCKASLVVVSQHSVEGRYLGQLKFTRQVFLCPGDRFLLRDETDQLILGGGSVLALDVKPLRTRDLSAWLSRTRFLSAGPTLEAIRSSLKAGDGKMKAPEICRMLAITPSDWETLAPALRESQEFVWTGDNFIWEASSFSSFKNKVLQLLQKLQDAAAWKAGWPASEVGKLLGVRSGRDSDFGGALDYLVTKGELVRRGRLISRAEHKPVLPARTAELAERLESNLYADGVSPRDWQQALGEVTRDKLVSEMLSEYLLGTGRLERLSDKLIFSYRTLVQARQDLYERSESQPFTTSQARQWLQTSRKFIIPLLEWMDRKGWTHRVGDYRVVQLSALKPGGEASL